MDVLDASSKFAADLLVHGMQNEPRLKQCFDGYAGRLDRRAVVTDWLMRHSFGEVVGLEIRVPSLPEWPTQKQWQESGLQCKPLGDVYLLSVGEHWQPSWLESGAMPFAATFQRLLRRKSAQVPMDLSLMRYFDYSHYQSPGQRDAVRMALFAPPGSTLLINLPTGTGKTLVAQVLTLTSPRENGLMLLVVPTVGLALELAKRFGKLLVDNGAEISSITAWHSGLSPEERLAVRQQIKSGTQRLIVTSPEAACSSLQFALFDAATKGALRHVVVDEAHLVSQWGSSFRPEFQQLGGLVTGLRSASREAGFKPCVTTLMSATITEETRQILRATFGTDMLEVHASHLRPEPSYWCFRASSEQEKRERVFEALAHAPRPLILYCMQPEEAEQWHSSLLSEGYQRVGVFTGRTGNSERERLLDAWHENKLEIMVATSAFGVGMNKDDIRCVIHATVPENMDRFYQEVGRSGRDGLACASLLIYTKADLNQAARIGQEKLITTSLGLERWRCMWAEAETLGEGRFRIDLSTLRKGLKRKSDENIAWNLRTVLMLMRAGVLALDAVPTVLPDRQAYQSDLEFEVVMQHALEKDSNTLVVRLLRDGHTESWLWKKSVEPSRSRSVIASQHNQRALATWLNGPKQTSLCDALSRLYSLSDAYIEKACGGCPACRAKGINPTDYIVPQARTISPANGDHFNEKMLTTERWQRMTGMQCTSCFVMYPVMGQSPRDLRRWHRRLAGLLIQLRRLDLVRIFKASPPVLNAVFNHLTHGESLHLLTEILDDAESAIDVNSSCNISNSMAELLLPEAKACVNGYRVPFNIDSPLQLVLVPENMPDPDHYSRVRYTDLDHKNWMHIDKLQELMSHVDY